MRGIVGPAHVVSSYRLWLVRVIRDWRDIIKSRLRVEHAVDKVANVINISHVSVSSHSVSSVYLLPKSSVTLVHLPIRWSPHG